MNDIEDLLRTAYHHAAEAVAPEDLRSAPRAPTSPSRHQPKRHRFTHPMLTAIAVVLVALAAALIPQFWSHPTTKQPATTGLPVAKPRFFAALEPSGYPPSVQFMNATTGQVTGHISSPRRNIIIGIAAEPDGRTFLVAVHQGIGCAPHLFTVRLNEAGRPGPLRAMRQQKQPGMSPAFPMALSPDGSTLAYFAGACDHLRNAHIVLANLKTGTATSTLYYTDHVYLQRVAVSDNGSVVSVSGWFPHHSNLGVTAILRPTPKPANVDSGAIVRHTLSHMALSPDGTVLYTCGMHRRNFELTAYDLASKHATVFAVWPQTTGTCVMAMAPSGRYLLLGDFRGHLAIVNTTTGRLDSSGAPVIYNRDIAW